MSLDIWGAIKRAITLPKSANSLADVLGKDVADALAATIKGKVLDAATAGLVNAAKFGITAAEGAATSVSAEVKKALTKVSPALAAQIDVAVDAGLAQFKTVAEGNITNIAASILVEVAKVLKV